ncbi:MAG: PEP/pyruvate-binding domain-containing protein [Victivallales bacterium]
MNLVFPFPGTKDASLSEVGGKARSLILMSGAGYNVPSGFVLSTEFFSPWLLRIKESGHWVKLRNAPHDQIPALWQALKESCSALAFDAEQRELLVKSFEAIDGSGRPAFQVAVRSSAPEEDLEGASFAGGYLSIMGVTRQTLEDAVRQAFSSCLDHRVYVYKKMRGFDPFDPKIAIVVQKQIASEIAGVGFSLNPLTNDFDEAVINSNWGLGETVVAGLSTPDSFIVDKVSLKTVETTLGSKQTSLWLDQSGETTSRQKYRSEELTLNPGQIVKITQLICGVEKHFGKAMDIEWCLAENELYLLQARPITAFMPVAPDMLTATGLPRRLYLDVTISVQGITSQLSVIGAGMLKLFLGTMVQDIFGRNVSHFLVGRIARIEHGRLYGNLSNVMGLFGKDNVASFIANMDSMASATLKAVDGSKYADPNFRMPMNVRLGFIFYAPRLLARIFFLLISPEKAHLRSQKAFARYKEEVRMLQDSTMPLAKFAETVISRTAALIAIYSIPRFMTSKIANEAIKRLLPGEPLTASLDKALPHNMTLQMGMDLSSLAALLSHGMSPDDLDKGLRDKTLPDGFLNGWKDFLEKYGHRGPLEIDLASQRYRDDPAMLLSQVSSLTSAADPSLRHKRAQAEREESCDAILAKTSGAKKILFKLLYKALLNLGGYRETHKYFISMALWMIKRRVVAEADELCAAGRLDSTGQAFDLTLEQLTSALDNPSQDLRVIAKRNREFSDKLAAVPRLPQVFDSRGRVLRPPVPRLKPGEFHGAPISAGSASGPVKVLHSPDEKPFLAGDILVARATDPGWTPLFASASAVILEVGGMLQHGALVAREYGLPCVAGVADATSILKDNSIVEVDGTAGIVRIIEEAPEVSAAVTRP